MTLELPSVSTMLATPSTLTHLFASFNTRDQRRHHDPCLAAGRSDSRIGTDNCFEVDLPSILQSLFFH